MRREHERARKDPERGEDGQRPAVAGPAAGLLALQRAAGNRAVGELLARQPKTAPPKKEAAATGNRVVFPGVGTIPVESVQMGTNRNINAPTGRGSDREAPAPSVSEIVITSKQGDHSTALFKASLDGKAANVDVILQKGEQALVIKLGNALVSSYSISGDYESWTLNFTSIEFRREGGDDERGE